MTDRRKVAGTRGCATSEAETRTFESEQRGAMPQTFPDAPLRRNARDAPYRRLCPGERGAWVHFSQAPGVTVTPTVASEELFVTTSRVELPDDVILPTVTFAQ